MDMLQTSPALQRELDEVAGWNDVDRLVVYLKEALTMTVTGVLRAAAAVRRLRELNADVDLGAGVVPYLERIAHGQVDPELFVRLQGQSRLLSKASTLPLPLQREIAADQPLKVMLPGGDWAMVRPSELRPKQITQVFETGRKRTDGEQMSWLREQEPSRLLTGPGEEPAIKLDRKHRRVWIPAARYLSEAELVGLLAELRTARRKKVTM